MLVVGQVARERGAEGAESAVTAATMAAATQGALPARGQVTTLNMSKSDPARQTCLLAVDLGLRTGLALYGDDGRLQWYRSRHFGAAASLRRAVPSLLEGVSHLVVEGGGALAGLWADEATRQDIDVTWVTAEMWRRAFLYPREQRSGEVAKRTADELARRVIEWSAARRPTSLQHDAAEAILIGLWGVLHLGWLSEPPAGVMRATL